MNVIFKTCTMCAHQWETIADLVRDENLYINGYQASFGDSDEGFFLLTHEVDHCGTTFAIRAGDLRPLYDGPEHKDHLEFAERCAGRCDHADDISACDNPCAMRWARDVLQVLRNHGPEELLAKLEKSGARIAA